MQIDIQWILTGLVGFMLILLGAIWNELKCLREVLTNNLLITSENSIKIVSLEKFADSRPCSQISPAKCSH